jgi:hypothetical protein
VIPILQVSTAVMCVSGNSEVAYSAKGVGVGAGVVVTLNNIR